MEIITTAKPYANGHLHLGHMVEKIQADVYARAQRLQQKKIIFVSGDDAHGVAIMLSAEKAGESPESFVKRVHDSHVADLDAYNISIDYYGSTHSPLNKLITNEVYCAIRDKGWIEYKSIRQPYDAVKGMFLADRYVKGDCPSCESSDQYGDGCENCGAVYQISDLRHAYSVLTQQPLEWRDTKHAFFVLERARPHLQSWLNRAKIISPVKNKLMEWFEDELRPWDITRDEPYFGFPVPDLPGQNYYVWLDAPCGYLASLQHWLSHNGYGNDWIDAWQSSHVTHFVGKDILYHHGLFWPAMLEARGLKSPEQICSHGFLTVNGAKMSKSRGTFVKASACVGHVPTDYIRYYIAAKLGTGIADLDLNWQDFSLRVNSDLIGKLINLGSRLSRLLEKHFNSQLGSLADHESRLSHLIGHTDEILSLYEQKNTQKAVRVIMMCTDQANQWISEVKPWDLAKLQKYDEMAAVLTTGLNMYRWLMHMISPICPEIAAQALDQFKQTACCDQAKIMVCDGSIGAFSPLGQRIVLNDQGLPTGMSSD